MAENHFKRALTEPAPITCVWLSLASDTAAELLAGAGFGAVVIDGEHAPNDIDTIRRQILAAERHRCPVIARTPINEPWVIKRIMDAGGQNVLVPMVDTAEQAMSAARACRFPPDGVRGVAAATRAADFGRMPGYLGAANAQACTIAQIESVEACKNIEAIAAVPGIDALFIGPSDLAASAGHLGNPKAPEVQQLIEDAIARIVAAGKPCGAFAFDPKVARRYFELGARFVAVGSDVTLLTRGASQLLAEFERAQ